MVDNVFVHPPRVGSGAAEAEALLGEQLGPTSLKLPGAAPTGCQSAQEGVRAGQKWPDGTANETWSPNQPAF